MSKLNISPDINGYGGQFPNHVKTHELNGGFSRMRQDIDEQSLILKVRWTLNQFEFNTVTSFFVANCNTQFLIDLILLEQEPTEETAILVPNSFSLISQNGEIYICEAELEVLPNLSSISCQIGFIPVQTELGFTGANLVISGLEYFVKNLPGHWG